MVVIAILAAITIASYNGITNRAKQTAVSSAVSTAAKKVQLYAIENSDTYPTTLTQVNIQGSDQPNTTTYRYTASNTTTPKTYCITALNGTTRAYLSNTTTSPQVGSCPGHEDDGNYVTNLVTNPSFENNVAGWNVSGGGTIERSNEQAHSGQYSLKFTPSQNAGDTYQSVSSDWIKFDKTGIGQKYYIYLECRTMASLPAGSVARVGVEYRKQSSSGMAGIGNYQVPGSWQPCLESSWATPYVGNFEARITYGFLYSDTGLRPTSYLDSAMFVKTEKSTINSVYDGNTPGWIWNGTPGNSTSTGPL